MNTAPPSAPQMAQTPLPDLPELATGPATAPPGQIPATAVIGAAQVDGEPGTETSMPARPEPVFSGAWWRNAVLWRTLTFMGLLVALLAAGTGLSLYEMMNAHINDLSKRLSKVRHVAQVAVLTNAKGDAGWLVTLEPQSPPLKVQRVGGAAPPQGHTWALWAAEPGTQPRPLGALAPDTVVQRLPLEGGSLPPGTVLSVRLQVAGETVADAPTGGSALFTGALIPNL